MALPDPEAAAAERGLAESKAPDDGGEASGFAIEAPLAEGDAALEAAEPKAAQSIPYELQLGVKEKYTLKASSKVKYKSSKKSVATVSAKGVITAKKKGTAIITVTSGKKALAVCTVRVLAAPKKVSLNAKSASIAVGGTYQLTPKIAKSTHASYTYTSSNKKVASVTSEGLVKGKRVGKATITVKTQNGKKATCKITVADDTPDVETAVKLVFGTVNPLEGTVTGAMANAFKEKVEALSGGTVTVQLYGSGVLGSESQLLNDMLSWGNNADVICVSASALIPYSCDKGNLMQVPYAFENAKHFWDFAASDLAQEVLSQPQSLGLPVRGICFGMDGFRHFFFKNPVSGLADLEGKVIRVSSDSIMVGVVESLGAVAAAVPFANLYSAIQTGVVDGSDQPLSGYLNNSFYEVGPNLLLDGHTVNAFQLLISENAWAKLSARQRQAVTDAGQYATQACKAAAEALESETLDALRAKGVTIVEVPDKSAWRAACNSVITVNMSGQEALYEKVRKLAG